MFNRKCLSGPKPASHHLIYKKQNTVLVTDFPEKREILRRWNDPSVCPYHRLDNDACHIPLFPDHVIHIACALNATIRVFQVEGTPVAIGIGGKPHPINCAPRSLSDDPSRITSEGYTGSSSAVIGAIARQYLVAGCLVLPDHLQRSFIRFRARGGEEKHLQALRHDSA